MYFTYIRYSQKLDQYYKGHTNNLTDRLKRHNAGYEDATKNGVPWKLIWNAQKKTRSEAMALEKKLKNLNRDRLEAFIKKYS